MTLLNPCPLCNGEAKDMGYGISCLSCGLWLGAGTLANDHGGYFKLWNTAPRGERAPGEVKYDMVCGVVA